MGPARRIYWWLLRRLPHRPARALRSFAVFVASGGRRRAFPPRLTQAPPIRWKQPEIKLACLAWGVPEAELAGIVERLLAVAEPARVIVVSDSDAVHLFRGGSCRFEYVPPRVDWETHFPERDYDAFVQHRLSSLFESYRVERLVAFGDLTDGLLRGLAGGGREAVSA